MFLSLGPFQPSFPVTDNSYLPNDLSEIVALSV